MAITCARIVRYNNALKLIATNTQHERVYGPNTPPDERWRARNRSLSLSPIWHDRAVGSEFRECESLNGNVNRQNCGGNSRANATAAAGAKGFSKVGFYTAAVIGEQRIPRFYLHSALRTAVVCFRAPRGLIKNGIDKRRRRNEAKSNSTLLHAYTYVRLNEIGTS